MDWTYGPINPTPKMDSPWIGEGRLQSTNDLSGNWNDVINITSPHNLNNEVSPKLFFKFSE